MSETTVIDFAAYQADIPVGSRIVLRDDQVSGRTRMINQLLQKVDMYEARELARDDAVWIFRKFTADTHGWELVHVYEVRDFDAAVHVHHSQGVHRIARDDTPRLAQHRPVDAHRLTHLIEPVAS